MYHEMSTDPDPLKQNILQIFTYCYTKTCIVIRAQCLYIIIHFVSTVIPFTILKKYRYRKLRDITINKLLLSKKLL